MKAPEVAILLLFLAFWVPLALAWLIKRYPDLVTKGQDAAGRGMAIGCVSILLLIVSVVLAISATIVVAARHQEIKGAWKVAGLGPLVGSIMAALVVYAWAVTAKNRRAQKDYEAAMSIPAALIVDDSDARFGAMYEALRPSFPTLEISMRHPGALYWQQSEWFPRLRLLMLGAEAMAETEGQKGELTQDLLDAMGRMKPACPIVLHAASAHAARLIEERLTKAGWRVSVVVADTEDWIVSRWREVAAEQLRAELRRRGNESEAP